ncbi:MAG: MFS transporter [Betaproteobacteria bacterium]|nr:MFS transporter [Betaproteobacteria bacterium]
MTTRNQRGKLRIEETFTFSLLTLALIVLIANAVVTSRLAHNLYEREITPEFNREAAVVGRTVAAQFARAIELGIRPEDLVGVEEFLAPTLEAQKRFDYLLFADATGKVLFGKGRNTVLYTEAVNQGTISLAGPAALALGEKRETPRVRVFDLGRVMNTAVPIVVQGEVQGWLNVGVDRSGIADLAVETRWDILIILLVSLLTAVEILAFLTGRSIMTPVRLIRVMSEKLAQGDWSRRAAIAMRDEAGHHLIALNAIIDQVNGQWRRLRWKADELARVNPALAARARRVVDAVGRDLKFAPETAQLERPGPIPAIARAPLFVYAFAEQLSASFIPLFAKTLQAPDWGLSIGVLIGLPISVFFAVVAASAPLGGILVNRLGTRWIIMLGSVPAIIGYVMAAQTTTIPDFLLWRCVTAIGYALITIACWGYLASLPNPDRRTGEISVFIPAAMAGAVCGTAIGAILADRIGYRATYLVSAGLVVAAAFLVWRYMEPKIAAAGRSSALRSTLSVLRHPRVAAIVIFGAMPAKIVLTGVLLYIVPVFLSELGAGQPVIGRIMMIYGLAVLLAVHFGARLSDRFGTAASQITWAGILTGLGTVALGVMQPVAALIVALVIMGLCQGIASAPLRSLAAPLFERDTAEKAPATLSGVIAQAEFVGAALGPVIAAILVSAFGYAHAIIALGGLSVATAVVFLLIEGLLKSPTANFGNRQIP